MRLTKSYNKNYNEFNDNYQLILPLNLENLIPEDDSVRLLSHVLEGLDYTKLYKAYSSVGRNRQWNLKSCSKYYLMLILKIFIQAEK